MDSIVAPSPLRPPVPPVPEVPLSVRGFLRAVRTNALTIWPQAAYRQDVTVRTFLGRTNVLLNGPDAIHHVLVGSPANYRRSPASIRILRPITGEGLLLSEGDDWKLQRRTVAPALAPRVMPMLAQHIVSSTDEALGRLAAQSDRPIDLLGAMQTLALEGEKYGIRVNTIMPGLMDTPMAIEGQARALNIHAAELRAKRDKRVPLKNKMGSAWDVAYAALFLHSDESAFITGVALPVDGGQSARIG